MFTPTLESLQATSDKSLIAALLIQWNTKSNNKEVIEVSEAFTRLFTYIDSMELKSFSCDREVSEMRADKNRAVLRARNSEEKIIELEDKIKKLEKSLKIFGGNIN